LNLAVATVAAKPTYILTSDQALERAQSAFERGRLQETIELLEQVLAQGVDTAPVRTMLGIAYARTHQVDKAFEHLERGVELEPEAFGPRCALGELYLRLCVPDQGRAALARALECASTSAERTYIATLLRDERARDKQRMQRPSFRKPFWPSRRRRDEGGE
jgi:tetratricopeptide (TPR) repeat protein